MDYDYDYENNDSINEEDGKLFNIPVTDSDNDDNEILDEQLGYTINDDKAKNSKGPPQKSSGSSKKKRQPQRNNKNGFKQNEDYYYVNKEKTKGDGNRYGKSSQYMKEPKQGTYYGDYDYPNKNYKENDYPKRHYNKNNQFNDNEKDYYYNKDNHYSNRQSNYNYSNDNNDNYYYPNDYNNKQQYNNKQRNNNKKNYSKNNSNNYLYNKQQGKIVEIEVELTDPPKQNPIEDNDFNLKAKAFIPKNFKSNL